VQANIQRFMDAIRARESRYQTTAGFYAEMGFGNDTSVNGGVGAPNINIPVFGNVTLQSGVKTADTFTWLAAGGNVTYPVAPGVALFGAATGDMKLNRHDTAFDQTNINIAGGLTYLQDKNLYRLTASYSELQVERDWFRKVTGATAEINHQLDELQTLTGFVQGATITYQTPNNPRDADLVAIGGGYRRAFIGDWQPLLSLSANYGHEHNVERRPDLGRVLYGGRVGVAFTPMP